MVSIMKRILTILSIGALMCISGSGCDEIDTLAPFDPSEVQYIKAKAGISDDDFCRHIDIENIHRTVPVVNRYINNLPGNFDARQRAWALEAFFRSFEGVTDARFYQYEDMRTPAVFFSFMDNGTERELGLDFSSTGKVLSYHYDVVKGANVKVRDDLTIEQVFDFINSLDFDVKEIWSATFTSTQPSSEENLQKILDALNAKAYTHEGDVWKTTGHLHYQTGEITIFPHLIRMHNEAYQADWLAAMREHHLTKAGGVVIEFLIPEDATIPQSHWEGIFAKYNFLDWAEMNCNRYILADETIDGGYEGNITAVDTKILIRPVETYNTSPRTLQLWCATEREYSSGSNPIIVVKQQSPGTIDISFKGVAQTGMTADIGPAKANIDLGALDEGTYTLNLYNGNVKQTAWIIVSAGSYTFEMDENPIFGFVHKVLNRIPEHTIWGHIGYHKKETSTLVDSFLEDLLSVGAVKKKFEPGDYFSFWINGTGNIVPYPGALYGYYFDKLFIYHYSGGLEKIDRLVEQYAHDHNDEMDIKIQTEQGEEFLSWMYGREY